MDEQIYVIQSRVTVSFFPSHFHFCNKDSQILPASRVEGLKVPPAALGSVCEGSLTAAMSSLSPIDEKGRPPPCSAALPATSKHEIKSSDGRRSSSSGGRWGSVASMARGGAG